MVKMTASKKPVIFKTMILKFGNKGEKTGWTYIEIPADIAGKLYPGNKKSFRVKGKLDHYEIKGIALLPMGNGNFIMPLNAFIRKNIRKNSGAMLSVKLILDKEEFAIDKDFLLCLSDEPEALSFFNSLPKSHQNYFSKWILSSKTAETKAKRINRSIRALSHNLNYGQMLQEAHKI
jgi:hypothetical protein